MQFLFLIKNFILSLLSQNNNHLKNNIMTVPTIEKIFADHHQTILNYVNSKVKNIMDAEDVTSNIFVKINRLLPTYDENKSKIITWVFTITNTAILDFWRTNKKQAETNHISNYVDSEGNEFFTIPTTKNADSNILNAELSTKIKIAFKKLTPNQFKIANLFFNKQYSLKEIMSELKLPENTIKVTINRARKVLQANLKPVLASNKVLV